VKHLAASGLQAECVIVGDDRNLDIAEQHGFHVVEQSNDFLGRKFNDGFQYALEHGADYVVSVGSDDWVHPDLFDRLPRPVAEPREPSDEEPVVVWAPVPEIITGTAISLLDLNVGRGTICRSTGTYGVIPWVLPAAAFEKCGGRPIPDMQARGIDGALVAGLGFQPEWVFVDPHPQCRVDFKSEVNLNSYASITGAIGDDTITEPWEFLRAKYPVGLVDMAVETHLQLNQ
jgi:glycosyltransferase involved in cell wall biosynthesis